MKIDLRGATENNSIRIDDVNLAKCVDRSENLRRDTGRVVDLVKRNPLACIRAASGLIKKQLRILPDIECLPIQQRLLLVLNNADVRLPAARGLSRQTRPL